MRIASSGPAYAALHVRMGTSDIATQHIQSTGGHSSADTMMSDGLGSASSRLVNSGLALDSAQSSYQRFKSIIDRYV